MPPWNEVVECVAMLQAKVSIHLMFFRKRYSNSYSLNIFNRPNGLKLFAKNRMQRILPPFIFGSILYVLAEMVFMKNEFEARFI